MRLRTAGLLAFTMAAFVAVSAPAFSAELAGVKMPDTLAAGDKTMKLNGIGLRKKAIFKVYVAGLYLETPSKDAAAIMASDSGRGLRMHFLRSVGKDKMTEAFREGFEANGKEKLAAQKANIDRLLSLAPDTKDGDEWLFEYVPGKGTTATFGGKEAGTIEGKDFADLLFSLWLGPKPPSDDLKKGLLGAS